MPADPKRVQTLFLAAREISSLVERGALLDRECCGDPELLRRVQALLKADDDPRSFLDKPAVSDAQGAETVGPPAIGLSERLGSRIGPYRLLQQIGEGGFGVVYMAEQDKPVHRRVALKVIKPGMDSAQVIARFEAERQALAMMDHQNIAKVFDAGATESGRPFFVMELVHGVPITKYCDDNHLTIRERLELLVPVCKAIQHAHQKGIIHRDLKPSNVLVCLYDGQAVAKVIDFGVAKAVEQRLTERTMFTQFGQIIGTFEYMSPEQAEMSQLGVDTRSDIYSLGVMLYELLTGSTPLQRQRLCAAGINEMLKMIKEEDPPRPSTRLSGSKEVLQIAAARRTDPVRLGKLLRGELDWVVMKCLEKDRTRRYDTANGLARDIERYLHDEPVEAGPPGSAYRLRKLARRHRTALSVTGLIAVLLVLAAAMSAWQAVRARHAEREALAERDRAEAGFRMARDAVDRFFTQVGESPKLKAQGMEKFRKDLLQNAKEFYERFTREQLDFLPAKRVLHFSKKESNEGFTREQLDAAELRDDLGLAHLRLARIHQALGDFAAAQTSSEKAVEILEELALAHADVLEYQRDLAASHFELGAVNADTGRLEKAEAAYEQALVIQQMLVADHPESADYQRALATTDDGLGSVRIRAGQFEKAQGSLEQGLAIWRQLVGTNPRVTEDRNGLASVQLTLGKAYGQKGQSEKAEAMLREAATTYQALVADCPDVPEYRNSLGSTYRALGVHYFNNTRQLEKADAAHQQELHIYEKLAREHPDVWEYSYRLGRCHHNLAMDALLAGRLDAALSNGDKAIELLEHVVDSGHVQVRPDLFDAWLCRANLLAGRGEHARAAEEASAVARRDGLGNANYYNIACVFALSSRAAEKDGKLGPEERTRLKAQYADRAMEFLRRAVSRGFQSAPALKSDPDFALLRSREDFQKLVQELDHKSSK
jgi:serine/threonine protein kinase/tetratricopeptide (TPR) repeat protein